MKQGKIRGFLLIFFWAVRLLATGRGMAGVQGISEDPAPDSICGLTLPVVSFRIGSTLHTAGESAFREGSFLIPGILEMEYAPAEGSHRHKALLTFRNLSDDTLLLHNVVPFGEAPDHVCLTGKGEHPLSRSHLFLPGRSPVNVILPDNAWELGFSAVPAGRDGGVCGLTRRVADSVEKGRRRRFETELFPGGRVSYLLWTGTYAGSWQEGLRLMFRDRLLYDVEPGTFDNSLFEREDLAWVRHAYVARLLQAWDRDFFDGTAGQYRLGESLARGKQLYGGDDFTGIWPTWPSLGIDARNQWDLFRDLPGGLPKLRELAGLCRSYGSALFICYNPWDESTREESHTGGMAAILKATGAAGVVLDTRGASSREFQEAADSVAPGIVMYSEGMAVPRDMQGIVAGRVHNALYYPPLLNLNKFIKPEFAIFRVAEIFKEPIRREFNTAFFNGYGTEINIFAPGKPEWAEEQYRYLGRTSRILRENSPNFLSPGFRPLLPTLCDSIWVNEWPLDRKTLYTLYSILPQGFGGLLLEVFPDSGYHFTDLWHHEERQPQQAGGRWMIPAHTDAFHQSLLGTNDEGAVGCIARLPVLLEVKLTNGELSLDTPEGDSIRIWTGNPGYDKQPLLLPATRQTLLLQKHFGPYEGKLVIQLFDGNWLLDERIASIVPGTPRLLRATEPEMPPAGLPPGNTPAGAALTGDMVRIPAGRFLFKTTHGDDFVPYPEHHEGKEFDMPSFLMDRTPVTNRQYKAFLEAAGYTPADTVNFLKHWAGNNYRPGEADFPVVCVSVEDARAYARWAGKRLPTEIEWQYAAQTSAGNEWPWKQNKPVVRNTRQITSTLTVCDIGGIDPGRCNPGDGRPYPVGKYPGGANPLGLLDLTGSVWQLTADEYFNGSYRFVIMKGGSFYKPSSSWWYVQGGPRELHYRQMLLRVSPGFERNTTVGFRCVKDCTATPPDR